MTRYKCTRPWGKKERPLFISPWPSCCSSNKSLQIHTILIYIFAYPPNILDIIHQQGRLFWCPHAHVISASWTVIIGSALSNLVSSPSSNTALLSILNCLLRDSRFHSTSRRKKSITYYKLRDISGNWFKLFTVYNHKWQCAIPQMAPVKNKLHLFPWGFWKQECRNLVLCLLTPN